MKRLLKEMYDPVDNASVALFRIFFGSIMLWEVFRYFQKGWIWKYWIDPDFFFTFSGFHWVHPWEGNGMYVHFFVLGLLAIFIIIGFLYRISAFLFFLGFSYIFLLDQTNYLNHFYLISLLSFILIWIPAHTNYSVDAALCPELKKDTIPAWALWLLRFQIGIAYFYGGIAKINPDWLNGQPIGMWLAEETDFPIIGQYFMEEWAVYLFAYGGLLLDLLIVPFLIWKPTRKWAFLFGLAFHLMNSRLFTIGIFPWFMIAATTIYFDPSWPKVYLKKISKLLSFLKLPAISWYHPLKISPFLKKVSFGILACYILWQLLFPLRHFLIPGNVNWTEEGHNFSWHMKLRDKKSKAAFFVKDLDTEEEWKIEPRHYLSRRQSSKMPKRPYMIWQFAQYLEKIYHAKGHQNVTVRAVVYTSLNGRKRQLLIDPNVDLTKVKYDKMPAPWINRLHESLRD